MKKLRARSGREETMGGETQRKKLRIGELSTELKKERGKDRFGLCLSTKNSWMERRVESFFCRGF
jgi:hypothetical protein